MDSAAISVISSLVSAIMAATLTYVLTKKREREADWRKLKLEGYKEYISALSAIVEGRQLSPEAHARYADSVNCLALVAPPPVLRALQAYVSENSHHNKSNFNRERHDELLNKLMNSMRHDIDPSSSSSRDHVAIWLITVPPTINDLSAP